MSDPDCIFCKIVAGELPAQIVDEDERTVAFMDINPGTRGHLLVIPREHSRDLTEIDRRGPGGGDEHGPEAGRQGRSSASMRTA